MEKSLAPAPVSFSSKSPLSGDRDVVLPVKDRGEVRMRVVAKPDRSVAELLHRLGMILPRVPKIVENVVEKIAL